MSHVIVCETSGLVLEVLLVEEVVEVAVELVVLVPQGP